MAKHEENVISACAAQLLRYFSILKLLVSMEDPWKISTRGEGAGLATSLPRGKNRRRKKSERDL